MSLKDHRIKSEYRSLIDHVVQDFYIPLLSEAVLYCRAVGFFSSSSLIEMSKGLGALAKRGGKIRLVASPYLSEEDMEAIRKGYEERDAVIERALLRQLPDQVPDLETMDRLNLLAVLIAEGILDIKIAYTENDTGVGMYHEKMGIIVDADDNKVAFSGSMNESAAAMVTNYETIDVFRSWGEEFEAAHTRLKENAFLSIWNNSEPNIQVVEFPSISRVMIEKYKRKPANYGMDQPPALPDALICDGVGHAREDRCMGARIPAEIRLYDYQRDAIAAWAAEHYRGIFDMATGTGKTLTGLGAVAKLSEAVGDNLAVIIVCPYQHLVEQWAEDIVRFDITPIIGFSSSSQRDWKKRLAWAIRDQKIRSDKRFFCFVCTNATFSKDYVQAQIAKIRSDVLLLVDEAHNFGTASLSGFLDDRFTYRLALSATLERYRDEEGTAALYKFFGKKCIEYPLERAIQEKKLTPYKYYPVLVYLNEEELAQYEQLSFELSKHLKKGKNGKLKLDSYGEKLAIKRARIVAGAINKIGRLLEIIAPYVDDHFLLVYCGATHVPSLTVDRTDTDEGEMKQIEAVTRLLGNQLGMKVSKFTAEETVEERNAIKQHFKKGDDLQAIVAIKCLDEGVNIPGIKTAFILASTTNPKEYIQRRGRVLRRAPGKEFAEIYDFVTLPRPLDTVSGLTEEQMRRDLSLVKNELSRIHEFGRLAMNAMEASQLMWEICDCYHLPYPDEMYEEEL